MALSFKTEMHFSYGVPTMMADGIARLVAPNAGPLTFKGTNTYLVGTRSLAVIDPGPESEVHRDAILAAADGRPITHIIVTHAHRDHTDGIDALVAATGARTFAFRRGELTPEQGGDPYAEFVEHEFMADVHVADNDRIAGDGWALTALHTPGHAPDHLCLALEDQSIVFSGDHVMAWNTSVIAPPEGRMSDYLRSLERLLARDDALFLPGHGGRIDAPKRVVKAYLLHRKWREQAILEAIQKGVSTARALLPIIYRDLDPAVLDAALMSLRAHIDHLAERELISVTDGPSSADCEVRPL